MENLDSSSLNASSVVFVNQNFNGVIRKVEISKYFGLLNGACSWLQLCMKLAYFTSDTLWSYKILRQMWTVYHVALLLDESRKASSDHSVL